ncbi:MAG: NADH-quinone oxidoreductase subunit L [Planctomycetaceae bacterium]|nr:NADH-quinone oxidoreductase subunit L [Planctomycetaceae bacterium]
MSELGNELANWLLIAWLLPLAGFAIEIFGGYWPGRFNKKTAAYCAVFCIGFGCVCSAIALCKWRSADETGWKASVAAAEKQDAHEDEKGHDDGHADEKHAAHGDEEHADEHEEHHSTAGQGVYSGTFYTLATFGDIEFSIDYYIDSLTLTMFCMVTFIATCIHVFAIGYMSDELTEDYVDHEVHLPGGKHFHRPGRFYKFFAFLSLFCFSMLGVVIAGNIFQVFVFWELVGICSYLLIGFYIERHSASTAANKAFIVNRVGDFGFIIGLMIIVTWFGTFRFDDTTTITENGKEHTRPGLFTMLRGHDGHMTVIEDADEENALYQKKAVLKDAHGDALEDAETGKTKTVPYLLLVVAGLGVFGGCIGKSAQFPLQTWLPDAMEGPTPVSALVHSSTMVAAGVYLAGRFYPMFTPEVLLTIAYIGCITLFVAATIAIVATDIKRVLAYSTISQLGYMMLGIGVAGWAAGLFHLITHAFFKSLMFLASGSVIFGCHHVQEMPQMGGLRKKMPITAYTMLVGVIAISGLAIPAAFYGYKIAFSGYHSKDAIVATALAHMGLNPTHALLFYLPLITAGITAFYMFRLWFYTFAGKPRDKHVYDHAHESPWVMTAPLLLLSVFAAFCAVGGEKGELFNMLTFSEPAGNAAGLTGEAISLPSHDDVHDVHTTAGTYALIAAATGALLAYLLYGVRLVNPGDIKRAFAGLHAFLVEKWRFDDLYDVAFVRPVHVVASWAAAIDKHLFDRILHSACHVGVWVSKWDRLFDEKVIDGLVNWTGSVTFGVGRSLRAVQTGRLRQYVMFIALSVIALFVLLFLLLPSA